MQIEYPMSKKLNLSEFMLVPNPHFNNIAVNLTSSTVHVPTNVFDGCMSVTSSLFIGSRVFRCGAYSRGFKD